MRMQFKHEDEVDGQPIGPVALTDDEGRGVPRPFDPNRIAANTWVTLGEAQRFAHALGLQLEES